MSTINRRQWLAFAGAALAACQPTFGKGISKMRFGLMTYQWGIDWDVPTLIANCTKTKAFAVELRTSANYAHGVEITLPDAQRREVKKKFEDSPVRIIGVASAERFDSPDPARVAKAIDVVKAHIKLSQDVGGQGVRVVPNDYHDDIPKEKTIAQIQRALNTVGKIAADSGQRIRVENHGTAGDLVSLHQIMQGVDQKSVRIKLNGEMIDAPDFEHRFALVKPYLDDTLHFHELNRGNFPYQLQSDLLIDAGWEGWWLLEASSKPADRIQAMIEQRTIWESIVAKSLNRA
jgi:predicted xylose isomerase-like sugar epimerase